MSKGIVAIFTCEEYRGLFRAVENKVKESVKLSRFDDRYLKDIAFYNKLLARLDKLITMASDQELDEMLKQENQPT